jgi:hypothetical protein
MEKIQVSSLRTTSIRPRKAAVKSRIAQPVGPTTKSFAQPEIAGNEAAADPGKTEAKSKRLRQGIEQFPIQILVPEETRDALRRRSEDTGASIRHIILRSLAADGIPVPGKSKRRD